MRRFLVPLGVVSCWRISLAGAAPTMTPKMAKPPSLLVFQLPMPEMPH